MEDTYIPVAANSTTLIGLLDNSLYTPLLLSSEHILFICPIIATILVLTMMVILLTLHAMPGVLSGVCGLKNKERKTGIKNQDKATILAVSIISFNRVVIFIIFDGLALHFRRPCSDLKVAAICEFSKLIYDIPLALLIIDLIAGSFCLIFAVIAVVIQLLRFSICTDKCCVNTKSIQDIKYYFLSFTALCFIFNCLMHTPYITMAYLSDAHYATSILVYYMTILFIEFGMVQYVLRHYYDLQSGNHTQNKGKTRSAIITIAVLISLLILLYGVVISASFFYYYLPLINVVTDLPNEGVIVYQTALILVGAYITYKTLFRVQKKKKDVHTVSRQVKENEISRLCTEIKCLKLEGSEGHETEIAKLRKEIILLQKEIQLDNIQSNITCLANESDILNRRKIAHLQRQGKKILSNLQEEVDNLKRSEHQEDTSIKINHLQNEIRYYKQLQLHGEQNDIDINKDLDETEPGGTGNNQSQTTLPNPDNNQPQGAPSTTGTNQQQDVRSEATNQSSFLDCFKRRHHSADPRRYGPLPTSEEGSTTAVQIQLGAQGSQVESTDEEETTFDNK